ncbi:DUF3365 domain-containing protein [uncultured Winogradskyella sp.]|uniref:c-type heme family protein n=1 Tax=uncultured Winogradskyella sp. TaxID=395353 RepID=UPI003516BE70
MKKIALVVSIALITLTCKEKNDHYKSISAAEITQEEHPGKALMEKNCYLCHSPTASHDSRIAPPMIAVKKHYIDESTTKEDFIKDMQEWIKNPVEANAKMPGAVRRFGVMPKAYYPEETIEQIADYIYDNDIEQPEWFEEHMNDKGKMHKGKKGKGKGKGMGKGQQHGKGKQMAVQDLAPAQRGLKYALGTKAVLGQNLMSKIQKEGTVEALAFCNEQAYPLTDSMATHFNATIKRVTDKPRNPKNQANAKELAYIETFKSQVNSKLEIEPISEDIEGKIHVYYPITTNTMCLQCHGKPEENIKPITLNKLKSLYPNDKAIGYGENEVRGMWHVTFDKSD